MEWNGMGRLSGKIAIITGAARGQGEREAELFAAEGAKVVLTDIRIELLQEVADRIKLAGGEAIAIKHDVASEEDWIEVVKTTIDTFDVLNILVNNAGIASTSSDVSELSPEEIWDYVLAVNLRGAFLGIKHAVPFMRRAGGGSIINISSVAGIKSLGGATTAYTVTKGALRSLSKGAAIEFAPDGIRVNSVHPGLIETPMVQASVDVHKDKFLSIIPLQRLGNVDDVAYGVLYLASDESSYVTGTELIIDGGLLAY
jgi:NAD(P)-dependent dehydrogenase (short-subunit alcohol dehydrogenase family)